MLPRLRHDALISRDHQHHRVEPMRAGQHVADEAGVPRDIDNADLEAARKTQVRKSEVDGHAASLLFGQAVWVDPGEGGDEGRLAVVDMPGGPDNIIALPLQWEVRWGWAGIGAQWGVTLRTATSTASRSVSSSPFNTVRGSRQHASFSMRAITCLLYTSDAADE